MKKHKEFLFFSVVLATTLTACSGNGSGATGANSRNVGSLTRSGNDIYVNGTKYDTTGTTVTMDGQTADPSALQSGMVVRVDGTISDDGTTGSASHIEYDHELKGTIEGKGSSTLTVLGQNVMVDNSTRYQGVGSFSDLSIGDRIEVSGYVGANGVIHASYIERELGTGSDMEDVEGQISGLTPTTFTINGLLVDYHSAQVSGELANGVYVEVEGDAASGSNVMIATRVEVQEPDDESSGHSGKMELEGYVTKITGPDMFEVNGQPVKVSAQTRYESDKGFAGVVLDVKIEVEGTVESGILQAAEVSFE